MHRQSMIPGRTALIAALAAALLLAGCAQYAAVAEKRPRFMPNPVGLGVLQGAEKAITNALRRDRREPLAALGDYLNAAETAAQQLRHDPGDASARRDYNFALGRVFATIRDAKLDPWTQPLRVPAEGGEFVLTHKPDARPQWNPALYEFVPADQFDIRGTYVAHRTTKDGLGAPLVAIGRKPRGDYRETFTMAHVYYGITALARFDARRCVLWFEDPLNTETVSLGGRSFPLAADFSVPLAVMLAKENPKKLELARLLRPAKYAETAHIARLQPYDPNKTVVLVTHGLMDSPATWTPMLNALRGDPEIRRHYQFWFYSYPSGYPYPYSAAILRRELDAVEKRFPLRKPMVLIGHSMGGMISRLMITDSGDTLWLKAFGKPPGQVPLSAKSREIVTGSLIFRHRPEVGRVIFIAAPHQGSDLARNWLGRIGSSLVKAPATLAIVGKEALKLATLDVGAMKLSRIPNSVDTLSPNNRFVKNVSAIPITPGIPYHTICGDRGRGDAPKSSDGIVPYWSSHLEGAQSELVVPSSHSAHQNPQAIEEVRRILKLHIARGDSSKLHLAATQ
jgi:pimeloyl-ACP methyl ester carboxylesterase